MLFPNLFESDTRRRERCEIKTYVGARPCYRCPEGPERYNGIGNKRRVTVGSKPPQISYGTDGSLAELSRCLGGLHGCPVYCFLAFGPGSPPKRGPETLGCRGVLIGQPKSDFSK